MHVTTIDIFCDHCNVWSADVSSADLKTAKSRARALGWIRKDKKDVCPACKENLPRLPLSQDELDNALLTEYMKEERSTNAY